MPRNYREKCLSHYGETCQECSDTGDVVAHHIDGNRTNNDIDNLVPLCQTCHILVHHGSYGFEHFTDQLPESAIIDRSEDYEYSPRFEDARSQILKFLSRSGFVKSGTVVRSCPKEHVARILPLGNDMDGALEAVDAVIVDETNPLQEHEDGGVFVVDIDWAAQFFPTGFV